jgi:hypothetical protein
LWGLEDKGKKNEERKGLFALINCTDCVCVCVCVCVWVAVSHIRGKKRVIGLWWTQMEWKEKERGCLDFN